MLSLAGALVVGISCAPSPSPRPEAELVVAPPTMYFTPLTYRYSTFISHPPTDTAYQHAYPYSTYGKFATFLYIVQRYNIEWIWCTEHKSNTKCLVIIYKGK